MSVVSAVTEAGLCKQDSVETLRAIQMEKATASHSRVHRGGHESRARWDWDRQTDRWTEASKLCKKIMLVFFLFFFKKGDLGGLKRCITVLKKTTCKLHKLKFNSDLLAVLFLHLETNTHLGLTTQAAALTFWPDPYLLILLPLHTLCLSLSSIHCSSLYGRVPCGEPPQTSVSVPAITITWLFLFFRCSACATPKRTQRTCAFIQLKWKCGSVFRTFPYFLLPVKKKNEQTKGIGQHVTRTRQTQQVRSSFS